MFQNLSNYEEVERRVIRLSCKLFTGSQSQAEVAAIAASQVQEG
jgi:hypothetical protein